MNIPNSYINGLVRFNMGPSWKKHSIDAIGVNHFTVGSLSNEGISSRYIRSMKQYQSWLGGYLVKFKKGQQLSLQEHCNLAVADQINWLEDFGDPNPYIKMNPNHIILSEPIEIDGHKGILYEFSGEPSHTEIGSYSNNPRSRYLMKATAVLFNFSNSDLKLKYKNLIPKDIFSEYETVLLKGYTVLVDLGNSTKLVLYGNTCSIKNENGEEVDYTLLLKKDILRTFKNVSIKKLR